MPSSAENVLERRDRLAGPTTSRRDHRVASPTGHTYVTYPGSTHLFPQLCRPTATPWAGAPPVAESTGERAAYAQTPTHPRNNKANAITPDDSTDYATETIAERNNPTV